MLADLQIVISEHLRLLDDQAPGLVTDLLITGSIPLGDYHPGVSDHRLRRGDGGQSHTAAAGCIAQGA